MSFLAGVALLLGGTAVVVLLLVLGVRATLRDRRHRGTSGTLASAVLEVESLFDSSKRHTAEAVRAEETEDDESGGPPGD